jgi:hypothetical protein
MATNAAGRTGPPKRPLVDVSLLPESALRPKTLEIQRPIV